MRPGAGKFVGQFAAQAHCLLADLIQNRLDRLQLSRDALYGIHDTVFDLFGDVNHFLSVLDALLDHAADLLADFFKGPGIRHLLHLVRYPGKAIFGCVKGAALDDLTGPADAGHAGKSRLPDAADGGHQSLVALGLDLHAAGKSLLHQGKEGIVKFLLVNDLPLVIDDGLISVELRTLGLNHRFGNAKLLQALQLSGLRIRYRLDRLHQVLVHDSGHVADLGHGLLGVDAVGLQAHRRLDHLIGIKRGLVRKIDRPGHGLGGLLLVLHDHVEGASVALQTGCTLQCGEGHVLERLGADIGRRHSRHRLGQAFYTI